MDPINYSALSPQPDFDKTIANGLQLGAGFQQLQQKRLEFEKAQLQAARTAAFRSEVGPALQGGDPAALVQLFGKYPDFGDQIKQASGFLNDADENNKKSTSATVYNGLQAGNIDIAKRALESRVNYLTKIGGDANEWKGALDALNSGDPEQIKQVQQQATLMHALYNPAAIKTMNEVNTDRRAEQLQAGNVRKGLAGAAEEEAKAATTSAKLLGQTLGALEGVANLKPSQVATAFKSMAAKGIIGKDQLPEYLDSIPADPAALKQFVSSYKLAGLAPEEQMKYTNVDANTVANNATSRANTASNNATQLQVQRMIGDRQDSKANVDASLDEDSLSTMAAQYLAGDKGVMQNLGRGAQGSANIVALRKEITKQAKEAGLTGPQIAAKMADYSGLTAGIRTSAQISARVENAISEAKELAPLAIAASREVSRSGLLPFGKIGIMFDTQTNDPALKKFVTANNGLVTAYGGAMARGQKPTVSDYEHAREILATAQSQKAYEATVNQMYAEMEAASRAPQNVREHLRNEIAGGGKKPTQTVPNPIQQGLPAGWSVKER